MWSRVITFTECNHVLIGTHCGGEPSPLLVPVTLLSMYALSCMCVHAGARMPLAQAHPFQPLPVTHEDDSQEASFVKLLPFVLMSVLWPRGFLSQ